MKRPRTLYHFTCLGWWQFIQYEGITRGECPISLRRVLNYPNLTTDPDPDNQGWARKESGKRDVRITVSMPLSDRNLVRWDELARQHGISGDDFRTLNRVGGGGAKNWWIYKGTITTTRFEAVDFLGNGSVTEADKELLGWIEASGAQTFDEFKRECGIYVEYRPGMTPFLTFQEPRRRAEAGVAP